MKVLHLITAIRKSAGTTTFVVGLAKALSEVGCDVTIGVVDYDTDRDESVDARITIKSFSDIKDSLLKYDIIHVHGIWSIKQALLVRSALKVGLPVIWSPHGMLAKWGLRHKWWKKVLPWHILIRPLMKRVTMWHATVDMEVDWIRDCGFQQPVVVAPLGTSLPMLDMEQRRVAKNKRVLYVGRVYTVKALDRLIEGFALVDCKTRKGWELRLVGPDQAGHMEVLKKVAESHGVRDSVVFAGPKYGEDLSDEYRECACLALVSHTENFGATVADAMSFGRPVITSTKTPWREVVDRGCGWWIDNDPASIATALSEMMELSSEELEMMGQKGRALVEEKYSWSKVADKMVTAYNTMIKE